MASLRYEHGEASRYDIERLLLPVDIMMVLVTYGNTGVSASLSFKWILLPVHNDVNTALCASCVGMASLWYGSHGPLWRTSATIGARNLCRLFQKSVTAARHGRPSTTGSHGPLWRTSATIGTRNLCRLFQKVRPGGPSRPAVRPGGPSRLSVHGPPPRPALTDSWNNRREESVPFVSKVHLSGPSRPAVRPGGPSRLSVHGPPPRPALTDFWNNRREESVPFVSKVHLSGPSRTSVTARSDGLLKQTAPHTDATATSFAAHVKTVWAWSLIFGTKKVWVWENVLDDPSVTCIKGHSFGIDKQKFTCLHNKVRTTNPITTTLTSYTPSHAHYLIRFWRHSVGIFLANFLDKFRMWIFKVKHHWTYLRNGWPDWC